MFVQLQGKWYKEEKKKKKRSTVHSLKDIAVKGLFVCPEWAELQGPSFLERKAQLVWRQL